MSSKLAEYINTELHPLDLATPGNATATSYIIPGQSEWVIEHQK